MSVSVNTPEREVGQTFAKYISDAISREVEEFIKQEVKKSQIEVEKKIREKTAEIIMRVSSSYSFEKFGQDIRITVTMPKL